MLGLFICFLPPMAFLAVEGEKTSVSSYIRKMDEFVWFVIAICVLRY